MKASTKRSVKRAIGYASTIIAVAVLGKDSVLILLQQLGEIAARSL